MKKKELKKALAFGLAAAMMAGTFTVTASAEGDKVKLSLYRATLNIAQPDADQVQKVQDAINEYIGDKINVEIELHDIETGTYPDKANLALANNEINLMWTASWMSTVGTNELYAQGAAYDLTDILPGTTLYEAMPDTVWTSAQYFGKDYFIPVYKECYEGYDIRTRQALVDEYGWDLSEVKELKDLEPMLEQLLEAGIKYPFTTEKTACFRRAYIDDFDFFTQTELLGVDRETNEVVNPIQTEQYKDFATLMCEWAEKGYLNENDVTKTTPDTVSISQDWGFMWWSCVPGDDAAADLRDAQDDYVIDGFTKKYMHSSSSLGSAFAITANCTEEQAKAAVDFLGLLYTDATLANLYTFGIEGEDYTIEDGRINQTSEKYSHSVWESTSVMAVDLQVGEIDNKKEEYARLNGEAEGSIASGFRFDKTSVEAQWAACTNVFEQYGYVLENGGYGSGDVESVIEEYQMALDEAGYQDILAEAQAQYNEWKA